MCILFYLTLLLTGECSKFFTSVPVTPVPKGKLSMEYWPQLRIRIKISSHGIFYMADVRNLLANEIMPISTDIYFKNSV